MSTFDIQCVVYVPIRCKEEEEGKRDRETKRLKKELISNVNITSMFVQLQVHSSYFHTENRKKRSKMSNPNRTIGENKENVSLFMCHMKIHRKIKEFENSQRRTIRKRQIRIREEKKTFIFYQTKRSKLDI